MAAISSVLNRPEMKTQPAAYELRALLLGKLHGVSSCFPMSCGL